jgi:hypothetical protein
VSGVIEAVMRHIASLVRDFDRGAAWIRTDGPIRNEREPVRLDERLGKIDRVRDHDDVGQEIAMTEETFGHRRPIG